MSISKVSKDFIEKQRQATDDTANAYIQSLYQLLGCIDLSSENGPDDARNVLHAIEQIEKIHTSLEKTLGW